MKKTLRILVLFLFCLSFTSGVFFSCSSTTPNVDESGESAIAHLFEWTGRQDYQSPDHVDIEPSALVNQSKGLSDDWYVDSSFYHIWVKSFNDYDGDGVGDFRGITAKLDYIKNEVGTDAIWLSPIFDCSGKGTKASYNMHGYDTTDYYNVNDYFGNMEHLEELLSEAHARGMKVIFDFVPNHTSNNHPWFLLSSKMMQNKKDWYMWNNQKLPWSPMGNANTWNFNIDRQAYYYAPFSNGMPDLNFRNYEVREEMKNVVRFWLNKGFDGVRIDAVRYLIEEMDANGKVTTAGLVDTESSHDFYSELRTSVIDEYAELGSPKFMVGEAWINNDPRRLDRYYGSEEKPEFNMLFDFDFSGKVAMGLHSRNLQLFDYRKTESVTGGLPSRSAVFLSNHDNVASRPGSVYKTEPLLRQSTAVSLLFPATPFVYYGNEVGQEDQEKLIGQDLRLRYPLDWAAIEKQMSESNSLLALHKTILSLRAKHPALRRGAYTRLQVTGDASVAAYSLSYGNELLICVFNVSGSETTATSVRVPDNQDRSKIRNLLDSDTTKATSVKFEDSKLNLGRLMPHSFSVYKIEN